MLSDCCSNLRILGFYNCGFREPRSHEDEAFLFLDRLQRNIEKISSLNSRWLDVENLNITSEIGRSMLTMIMSMCLNLKQISLGMNTSISDDVLGDVFMVNNLHHLHTFKCAQSRLLTKKSVMLLLDNCRFLTTCLDLEYWEGINSLELASLKDYFKNNNTKLKMVEDKEEHFEAVGGIAAHANLPENLD